MTILNRSYRFDINLEKAGRLQNLILQDIELGAIVDRFRAGVAFFQLTEQERLDLRFANLSFYNVIQRHQNDFIDTDLEELITPDLYLQLKTDVMACLEKQAVISSNFSIDTDYGTIRWLCDYSYFQASESEPAQVMLHCTFNNTHLLERIQEDRYQAIFKAFHNGIVIIDKSQKIKFINASAHNMFGYEIGELAGKPLGILLPARFKNKHSQHIRGFEKSPATSQLMEERTIIYGLRKDNSEFPTEISIAKIQVDGITEMAAIVRDVSKSSKLIEDLKLLAKTDALTGINNRRYGEESLRDELDRSRRYKSAFSVVMFDLDLFKNVNDVYGHEMGDKVLIAVSNEITKLIRDVDVFCRWGGEEFLLILPETDLERAFETTERLRQSIFALTFKWMKKDEHTSASFGIAESKKGETNYHKLVIRADKAMYEAKKSGRNCIR